MPWAALIAGTASLAGGALGANAQSSAASKEAQALQQALDFQKGVYSTAQTNLSPYISTGTNGLYSLASLFGLGNGPNGQGSGANAAFQTYTNTPAYQFAEQQGLLGANRGLAAAGLTGSGAQAKGLTQYAEGYASQGFNNYVNQLAQLAGLGSSAATSLGGIGTNVGSQFGSTAGGIGAALGAGTYGSTASLLQGIQNGLGKFSSLLPGSSSYGFGQSGDTSSGWPNAVPVS
jgi:hypothetical protein